YLAGTNPTNAASVFRVTSITMEGSTVRIAWSTVGTRTNVVQGSIGELDMFGTPINPSYPADPSFFFDISDPIVISGSGDAQTNFVDDGGWVGEWTNWPARYYRVRPVP